MIETIVILGLAAAAFGRVVAQEGIFDEIREGILAALMGEYQRTPEIEPVAEGDWQQPMRLADFVRAINFRPLDADGAPLPLWRWKLAYWGTCPGCASFAGVMLAWWLLDVDEPWRLDLVVIAAGWMTAQVALRAAR